VDFVSRLRQADSHCTALVSKSTKKDGPYTIDCKKINYHVSFPDKHLLLAHHFHVIDGEKKEMIRLVTCGLPLPRIEVLLCKAMSFLKTPSSEFGNDFPGSPKKLARVPHPKAIICSMLECAEEFCKSQVTIYQTQIEKIEERIDELRDTGYSQPRDLEINYIRLSHASIKLSEIRQKIQYSLSSIACLEEMTCLPTGCSIFPNFSQNVHQGIFEEPQDQLCDEWRYQLEQARIRLMALKSKCQQRSINIDNLQERARWILSIVGNPLSCFNLILNYDRSPSCWQIEITNGAAKHMTINSQLSNIRPKCSNNKNSL
jgi:chaperonin cofactor prefoldin